MPQRSRPQFLRGHPYVEEELAELQSSVDASLDRPEVPYSELLSFRRRPECARPLLVSLMLMAGQQVRDPTTLDDNFFTQSSPDFTDTSTVQSFHSSSSFPSQLSGVNAVIFFSVSIFQAAGTPMNSFLENAVVGAVQVAGTVASCAAIDRAGRRALLVASAAVMAVSLAGLGKGCS